MPRLVHDGSNSASEDTTNHTAKISLSAIQQAAVLAQCLHVSRRSRSDEMSGMSVLNESSGLVVFHIYAWRIK